MTPDEAKQKWCPMMGINTGISRYDGTGMKTHIRCIADQCMLWQWSVTPKGAAKREGMPADGYCGLARP